MRCITLLMKVVPSFRLDLTAWALRRRPEDIVDRWDGQTYARVLVLEGKPVEVEVTQIGSSARPRLRVAATGTGVMLHMGQTLTSCVERMLGTRIDLRGFYQLARRQPELGELVRRFRGLKPPRFPSVHESLLCAFACQQVSRVVGVMLLNRLAENYGLAFEKSGRRIYAFPRPKDLAAVNRESLGKLGFSRQKARAIIELSLTVTKERLDLEKLAILDEHMLLKRLNALRGVGRWSAEYVSLRGLGKLHVFPGDDVGAQNKLQRYLGLKKPPDYKTVHRQLTQ